MDSANPLDGMYNGMRVVAVMQNKGGVGKTFLTSNIAVRGDSGAIPEIRPGKKILLMDVDPQQNLSSTFLEMEPNPGRESKNPPIHPDFDPNDPDDREWGGRSSSIGVYYGDDVVPYPTALEHVEILPADGNILANFHNSMQKASDEELVEALTNRLYEFFSEPLVQERYDLILLDCPPGKGYIHIPILQAATDIIIPCEPQPHCVDGTSQTISLLQNQNNKRKGPPVNVVGVIPNRYDMRSNDFRDNLALMRDQDIPWSKYVPDFELKLLRDYRISHLPEEVEGLRKFKSKDAEQGMAQFIDLFRSKVYWGRSISNEKEAG